MAKRVKKTIEMRQENFEVWVKTMKQKWGENLLDWPASAREWYRSIEIKEPKK